MADTSLNYDFPSTFTFDKIVDMAFQNIGIPPQNIVPETHVRFARDALNLEMHQWSARHTSLCWVQRDFFSFVQNQIFYKLPPYVYKIQKAVRTVYMLPTSTQNSTEYVLNGTPFASEGNAIPCFTPSSSEGLTQTNPGGYIGFQFQTNTGSGPQNNPIDIWYVGINTLVKRKYTLAVEYSYDNVNWEVAKQVPTLTYLPGVTSWFVCEWPPAAAYWRIREVKNAILSIQQIYFARPNTNVSDMPIDDLSRYDFLNYPQKIQPTNQPIAYYFNEKKDKTLYMYGNFYAPNMGLLYTCKVYPQDVDQLFQSVDVDVKFYLPLVTALSYHAAKLFGPEHIARCKADYDEVYRTMASDDGESAPLRFSIDLGQNWANV